MAISFNKMVEEGNNLMIVDSQNLAFRWKHSGTSNFKKQYLDTINSLKRSYKAKYVVLASDKGKSWYRKQILPTYKANREELHAQQTEEEKQIFLEFMQDFRDSLEHVQNNSNYPILQYDNTEADDIAAYIVGQVDKLFPGVDHTWLISTDEDWDLLVSDSVSRFSYVTRKEITLNQWSNHYDYPKEHHLSVKCLMGDSGDNVKGVESIGPKRAANLVATYGSALDVADAIPVNSHLKFIQNLNKSKDLILTNYYLMDLESFCYEALGDNTSDIDSVLYKYARQEIEN